MGMRGQGGRTAPGPPWWLGWALAALLLASLSALPATSWVARLHAKQFVVPPEQYFEDPSGGGTYVAGHLRGGYLLQPWSWLETAGWRKVQDLGPSQPLGERRAAFQSLQPPSLSTAAHLRWLWGKRHYRDPQTTAPLAEEELLLAREGMEQDPGNAFFALAAFRAAAELERWSEAELLLERASEARFHTSYEAALHALVQREMEEAHGYLGAAYRYQLSWWIPRSLVLSGVLVTFIEAPEIDRLKARHQMARVGEVLVRTGDSEDDVRAGSQLLRVAAFGGKVPRELTPRTSVRG